MKKITFCLSVLFLTVAAIAQSNYKLPANVTANDYLPNTIIIKVKDSFRPMCTEQGVNIPALQKSFTTIGFTSIQKKFANEKPPREKFNKDGLRMADLSLIYECKYAGATPIDKAINALLASNALAYAEPHFVPVTTYTTNDPQATTSGQYHLNRINAYNGWNTSKGDTTVIIGITDTGVEYTHSDLGGNIKYNYADPINSIDDDLDGFIDNYRGWDCGMNDNDATWQGNAHGVHVSGIASAATDNANGIAGVGFKCKFLPVKIANASGALVGAYDGIKYAADHGCKVINCSWGGPGGGSFGQDICTYATINKDALVVAACGNTGLDELFYPAAYDYVLAVVNTQSSDIVNTSSTYGYFADVSAPGTNINATWTGNSYVLQTGTSMASPVTAGVVGIVRSMFPSYSALQAGERVKTTTDNHYSLPINNTVARKDKLGTGRVNLGRALTDPLSPSVLYSNLMFDDKNDDIFNNGDTLRIGGLFTNYLAPTTALTATLATLNAGITNLSNTVNIGALAMMGTLSNTSTPFSFRVISTFTPNTPVNYTLTVKDGTYTARQYFTVLMNVDYINITVNDVLTTATSKGRDFYSQDGQLNGLGFLYKGANLIYDGGLMIGADAAQVSDCVRGTGASNDAEFKINTNISEVKVSPKSNFDTYAKYSDSASATVMGLMVDQRTWAWTSTPDKKYVIWEYIVKNNSATTYTSMYVGICADWDIDAVTYANNKSAYDATNKMGYTWCTNPGGLFAGIKLLTSSAPPNFYAIDNVTGGGGGVDISGGFPTNLKYQTLSTQRLAAGSVSVTGNDVINVMGAGPYTVAPGQTFTVAFALIAGDSLTDLQNSAGAAQIKYNGLASGVKENIAANSISVYPNPATDKINVKINNNLENDVMVYDITGKVVYHNKITNSTIIPTEKWGRGVYFVKVSNSEVVNTTKIVLQ